MLSFLRNPWERTPLENEFLNVNLELCENGRKIIHTLKNACSNERNTKDFYNYVSSVSFDGDRAISHSSQLHILFTVIQSGDVEKLNALRLLPSYDQIPLNLKDTATGKTTIQSSGSFLMRVRVEQIITHQRIEKEGGAELLANNGYHQFASGISIIPYLKVGSSGREKAEEAKRRDATMEQEISAIMAQS